MSDETFDFSHVKGSKNELLALGDALKAALDDIGGAEQDAELAEVERIYDLANTEWANGCGVRLRMRVWEYARLQSAGQMQAANDPAVYAAARFVYQLAHEAVAYWWESVVGYEWISAAITNAGMTFVEWMDERFPGV